MIRSFSRISLAILFLASACSLYRVKMPERPALEAKIQEIPYESGFWCVWSDGSVGDCVTLYAGDWKKIREYYLTIERELKAACLALGGSEEKCRIQNQKPKIENKAGKPPAGAEI